MVRLRKRGEQVREFILDNVEHHPRDIAKLTANAFGTTRQAVNKHIQNLVRQKALVARGTTRDRYYLLQPLELWEGSCALDGQLAEDAVWRTDIAPRLRDLPDNVLGIWHYAFTEMLNNAIDHSGGTHVQIEVSKTASATQIVIYDNGEGIFRKIQRMCGLEDERHAVLELSKGKLTTDPERHTGEGIFFSSRMFDDFAILSGGVYFSHKYDEIEDWILESQRVQKGTSVFMKVKNNTARTTKQVFDAFSSDEDYGFNKTVVPVKLVQYGDEKLVSRSQAKRLLARIDKFTTVLLDFANVEAIGQAFADEVFRVFTRQYPDIEILYLHTNQEVEQMIRRAQRALAESGVEGLGNQA